MRAGRKVRKPRATTTSVTATISTSVPTPAAPIATPAPITSTLKKEFWHKEQLVQKWLHSRKVAIYVIIMIVATIALFIKLLDGDHWTQVTKWATTGYMAGNALDGFSDAWKSQAQGNDDGSAASTG